ncbi:MAG: hypothetical protein ISS57_13915 [Anaerolineales bacterium]|nr:hypothetical protein [Anaerolineales bacterium]
MPTLAEQTRELIDQTLARAERLQHSILNRGFGMLLIDQNPIVEQASLLVRKNTMSGLSSAKDV